MTLAATGSVEGRKLPHFNVRTIATDGHSLIEWDYDSSGIPRRSLQVETHIALLWCASPELLNATNRLLCCIDGTQTQDFGEQCRLQNEAIAAGRAAIQKAGFHR